MQFRSLVWNFCIPYSPHRHTHAYIHMYVNTYARYTQYQFCSFHFEKQKRKERKRKTWRNFKSRNSSCVFVSMFCFNSESPTWSGFWDTLLFNFKTVLNAKRKPTQAHEHRRRHTHTHAHTHWPGQSIAYQCHAQHQCSENQRKRERVGQWERVGEGQLQLAKADPIAKRTSNSNNNSKEYASTCCPLSTVPLPQSLTLSLSLPPHNSCSLRNEALFCCCVCVLNDILYACTLRVCVCMCECGPQVLSMLLITNVA